MKRAFKTAFVLVSVFLAVSCTSTALSTEKSRQFSLKSNQSEESSFGLLMGTVSYGAGFYFPTNTDILDISLLKTDSTTGLVTEISHQRIRNLLNFPIQFTVHYDKADFSDADMFTLIVNLTVNDVVTAQGFTILSRSADGFLNATLTLMSV